MAFSLEAQAGLFNLSNFKLEPRESVSVRWTDWLKRFETYLVAMDITDPTRQRAMLLLFAGEDIHRLFSTLPGTGEAKDFDKAKKALNDHFLPKRNKEFETYMFRLMSQEPGETLDQFHAKLRTKAVNCEFGDMEAEIKSQIIQKTHINKLRIEALNHPEHTLEEILRLGRTYENTAFQNKIISKGISGDVSNNNQSTSNPTVNKIKGQIKKSGKACYNCGGSWPHRGQCPAYGKVCHACNRKNHFAKCCRSKPKNDQKHEKGKGGKPPDQKNKKKVHTVELVDNEASDTDEVYSMYHIKYVNDNPKSKKYYCQVYVNGLQIKMEIDTGSDVSIINEETFKALKAADPKVKLSTKKPILSTYSGETSSIKPLGVIENVNVTYEDQQQSSMSLIVTPGSSPNLLGKDWMSVLKLNWNSLFNINKVETSCEKLRAVLNAHQEVFSKELGTLKEHKVSINIDKSSSPVFCKPRSVPLAFKDKVNKELSRLEQEGVIKQVPYSRWAAPIVPVLKASGQIRICGDYKQTVNKVAKPDSYPLPHVDELYAKLSGGKQFTKLDLSNAYQQLMLDEASQELTTINTEKGLFSYQRMPFGISAAPAIFQRTMETVLQGIPMTAIYLDDILITGKDLDEHLQNLDMVLNRLQMNGMRLRNEKCSFLKPEVVYLGHKIDSEGIHPTTDKCQAIKEAPVPTNLGELRSYLGLLNYYHKFLPNLSSTLAPLYKLLNKNTKWTWTQNQMEAFTKSKELLLSSNLLVHYNPDLPIVLCSDASPVGIGSVLSHIMPDGSERPIAYASRTLTSAEKNYSQIEKEGLGVIYGVKHFHKYVFGRDFVILTDHKPLLGLFSEDKISSNMAPPRLIRWALQLAAYKYKIRYRPGKELLNADGLSRLPHSVSVKEAPDPPEVVLVLKQINCTPVTSQQIATATRTDPLLSRVYDYVLVGWPEKIQDKEIQPYFSRLSELSVHQGCLLWGSRVVVPNKYRQDILEELHDTHPGIVRMKGLGRSYVWWPGLDEAIEKTVKECLTCQQLGNKPSTANLNPWEWPTKPWDRVHIDYAGPVEGKMILIIVDSTTKYIDAHVMSTSTASATIDKLRHTFALLGLPRTLVSDNGPAFTSEEFNHFCVSNGIKHVTVSPYHASSNGLAERAVQTVKVGLKKTTEGTVEARLYRFLLNYHKIPQSTTGMTPSEVMLQRRLRTRIDLVKPDTQQKVMDQQVKMKEHFDKTSKHRNLCIGDPVFAYDFLHSPKWLPGVIIEKLGPVTFRIELLDGRTWRRHTDHIKYRAVGVPQKEPLEVQPHLQVPTGTDSQVVPPVEKVATNQIPQAVQPESISEQPEPREQPAEPRTPVKETPVLRRSARTVKPPDKLNLWVRSK